MNSFTKNSFINAQKTADSKNGFTLTSRDNFCRTRDLNERPTYQDRFARTASAGFSSKSAFDDRSNSPSLEKFQPQADSRISKGYSFSHNKKMNFSEDRPRLLPRKPVPTKYEKVVFGKQCRFEFESKYKNPFERQKLRLGPGQYKVTELINKAGTYPESKHYNSCCGKVGKEVRFRSDETVSPGPGKYPVQLGLDPIGNYFNSRIPSKGIRTFGKATTTSNFGINGNPNASTVYHFPDFPTYLSK